MKRLFFTSLLTFVAFLGFAQIVNYYPENDYSNSSFNLLLEGEEGGIPEFAHSRSSSESISLDSLIYYKWDIGGNSLVNSFKYLFTYSGNDEQTEKLFWNEIVNEWERNRIYGKIWSDNGLQIGGYSYDWLVDDNIWVPSDSSLVFYDENNQYVLHEVYMWSNSINDWRLDYKNEYTYVNDSLRKTYTHSTLDTLNQMWVGNVREENMYDEDFNIIGFKIYYWNEDVFDWYLAFYYDYNFVNEEFLEESILYRWEPDSESLEINSKTAIIHSADFLIDTVYFLNWDQESSLWSGNIMHQVIYGQSSEKLTEIYYDGDYLTGIWTPSIKEIIDLEDNGNDFDNARFVWNLEDETWVGDARYLSIYNEDDVLSDHYTFRWDTITSDWQNTYSNNFIFDVYGNMEEMIYSQWDESLNDWEVREIENSYYDTEIEDEDIVWTFWIESSFDYNFKIDSIVTTSFVEGPEHTKLRRAFYYSQSSDIENNISVNRTECYPNPASDYILFELNENADDVNLTIYNSLGKLIYNGTYVNNTEFFVDDYQSGMYYYKLKLDGYEKTGKFIVE